MLMGERRVDIAGELLIVENMKFAQDPGYPGAEHSGRGPQFHV